MRQASTQGTSAPAQAIAQSPSAVCLMAVALALVTIALYWPVAGYDFVNYDDDVYVTSNLQVQNGLSWETFKWACVNPVCCNWHPLTVWSHMLVCQMCGLDPKWHHLGNVLLHALNASLAFLLLQKMTGATWRSLMVAALFALHPLRVESVAWVSERKDELSGCFGLLALMAYASYARASNQGSVISNQSSGAPARDHPSRGAELRRADRSLITDHRLLFYLLSLFFLALGLMSKPVLVTWPFVMLLLDYWPLRRFELSTLNSHPSTILRLVREKIPFLALAAFGIVMTCVAQKAAMMSTERLPLGARFENSLVSYSRYVTKLVWPRELAIAYLHPGYWPIGKVAAAGVCLLSLSLLVWVQRRRCPALLVGWLWYLGTLLPMIGLVQVGSQAMADHHSYLPSLGILVLAVWGAHQWTRAWRYQSLVLSLAGGTAIVLCIAWSRQQLRCWQDGESLFRHALQFAPDDDGLHNALGMALDKKGQTDAAIQEYHVALRLNPSSGLAHENLGVALGKKGQADEAMRQLVEAVRLSPERLEFRYNLGAVLYQQGRTNEANVEFQSALRLALRLTPRLGEIPDWGAALGLKGPAAEAIRQFRETTSFRLGTAGNGSGPAQMKSGEANGELGQCQEAVRLNPQSAAAHSSLGTALGKKGRMEEAGRQFQEAIRLAPDYAEAHNNLAVILYQQGQVEEAIRHLQEALRLKPDYAGARKNLEAALAASGRASRPPDSPPAR